MARKYILSLLMVAVLIMMGVAFFLLRPRPKPRTRIVPYATAPAIQNGDSTAYNSGLTGRALATLPDGTRLILNPNTVVHVPKDFNLHSRQVRLDGDAFFDIARQADRPFVVHTRNLVLTVMGTSFRVSAFARDEGESAEVLRGQIRAAKAYHSTEVEPEILSSGDMIMINRSIDLMEKETFDTTTLRSWCDDQLVFINTPFPQVIQQLEDWYGITIDAYGNTDNIKGLTGTFDHQDLTAVLEAISLVYHCRYKIEKYSVRLNF